MVTHKVIEIPRSHPYHNYWGGDTEHMAVSTSPSNLCMGHYDMRVVGIARRFSEYSSDWYDGVVPLLFDGWRGSKGWVLHKGERPRTFEVCRDCYHKYLFYLVKEFGCQ